MTVTNKQLLAFLTQERQELRQHQLLKIKGYLDPTGEDFGLNSWTSLLADRQIARNNEAPHFPDLKPERLVSMVAIPDNWGEELVDTNSPILRGWLKSNTWGYCPVAQPPFNYPNVQACSEGLIQFQSYHGDKGYCLEKFLLIRTDGVVEFGLGREAYSIFSEDVAFHLITTIARLWQFLGALNELIRQFWISKPQEVLCIVNLRGTRNALLADLARGWREPFASGFDSYKPRCPDKHLQIQRSIKLDELEKEIETLIKWYATRIDNAWGQFEPRCYTRENVDGSRPFAGRNVH